MSNSARVIMFSPHKQRDPTQPKFHKKSGHVQSLSQKKKGQIIYYV